MEVICPGTENKSRKCKGCRHAKLHEMEEDCNLVCSTDPDADLCRKPSDKEKWSKLLEVV